MAIAVQSSSTTAWASGSTIVLTKPTGLAVGDLMIVHIGVTSGTVTTLSGWTLVGTKTLTAETLKTYAFSKIADSTDVAASNFTFSYSGTLTGAGAILRIDGHSAGAAVYTSASDDDTDASPPTFTNTVTPVATNSMLLMLGVARQVDTVTTISGYAVVTSTPTFTEVYDFNNSGGTGNTYLLCGAYGTRAAVTATGNSTWNYSAGTNPDAICQMLVIAPSKDFTILDTVTITDSFLATLGIFVADIITLSDTFTSTISRLWTKLTRNVKTWTNQNKD